MKPVIDPAETPPARKRRTRNSNIVKLGISGATMETPIALKTANRIMDVIAQLGNHTETASIIKIVTTETHIDEIKELADMGHNPSISLTGLTACSRILALLE